MTDTFNVTASYDKASYNIGDTITVTISGVDVVTTTSNTVTQAGPLQIPVVNPTDGAQSVVNIDSVPVTTTVTVAANDSVVIDTTRPIVDTSATPRTWTVSNTGLFITATA